MQKAKRPSEYWARSAISFPELSVAKMVMQRNGQSVFDHTMRVIDTLETQNPITLLSGLFHDLGKCYSERNPGDSGPKFPGHDAESVVIVLRVLPEWGATNHLMARVARLVGTHMYDITQSMSERRIRQFVATVGVDDIDNWFVLRLADASAYANSVRYCKRFIKPFRTRVTEYVRGLPKNSEPLVDNGGGTGRIQFEGGDV